MSSHQVKSNKLNMREPRKRSVVRGQVTGLIENGYLTSTQPRIRMVKSVAEKMVTIAREGKTFLTVRKLSRIVPYDRVLFDKLYQIAAGYVGRPGGYTRTFKLGTRLSDTAKLARLSWT